MSSFAHGLGSDLAWLGGSDEMSRVLVEGIPGVAFLRTHDARQRCLYVSPGVQKLLGVEAAAFLDDRSSWVEHFHPDDAASIRAAIGEGVVSRQPYRIRYRLRHADGSWRWVEERGQAVPFAEQGGTCLAGVLFDVAQQRAVEQALAGARAELQSDLARRSAELEAANGALEARVAALARLTSELRAEKEFSAHVVAKAPTIICCVRPDGVTVSVNGAIAPITGYAPEEVVGRNWWELFYPGEEYSQVEQLLRDFAVQGGSVVNYDMRLTAKDGTHRIISWNSVNRFDAEGRIMEIVGIGADITARRQAEERVRRDEALIRQLFDVQDRERKLLAYEIHDGFVQDVVGAKMFVEALEHKLKPIPGAPLGELAKIKDLLQKAVAEGRRLSSDLRPLVIDEGGLFEALQFLAETHRHRGSLEVEIRQDAPFQRLPALLEGTLYRIVQEALTNVERHAQTNRARVTISQAGARLRIEIADEGRGFDLNRVASDRLGLEGIRRRAAIFEGTAEIFSRPGSGTRVVVEFPLSPEPAATTEGGVANTGSDEVSE